MTQEDYRLNIHLYPVGVALILGFVVVVWRLLTWLVG